MGEAQKGVLAEERQKKISLFPLLFSEKGV